MARPKRTKPPPPPPPPQATASPSLGEALLLATVCMVGLPVEVQVRDGSAYEGIFHTACVDGGYGVVLKKARKTVNGMGDANFPLGSFVDTLVVLPDDLVQLIAKDFSLPSKDVYRTPACDMMATSTSVKPQSSHMKDPKTSKAEYVAPLKQVKKCSMPGLETHIAIGKKAPTAIVGSKDGNVTSSVSSTKTGIPSKTIVKESKLNPCAKLFSPSFASSRPVLAAAPSVNSNYISNSVSGVPTGVPVFETNFARGGSSLSSKAAHYNNLPPANYGISPQYIQSTVGHNVARLDPTRIGTPYYPMQVGPTYISPSPQPVAGGKFSPLVYVHPVSQDAMHGAPAFSQGWSLPVSLNSYQANFQKFQGTAPFYVAPPVMATGNLPLVVPSPTPLVQPFQAVHPIMVPSASSMVPGKYM